MMRDRGWFQCIPGYKGEGTLSIRDSPALKNAIPGSPIVTDDGFAIGVVASGEAEVQGGPVEQPVLVDNLPGWLLRDLGLTEPSHKVGM
jgi:hypothetical protein